MLIHVFPDGRLKFCGRTYRCALGRGGVRSDKSEGDGATPIGTFPLRQLHYRRNRVGQPRTRLPRRRSRVTDGWCDDPAHPAYNRRVSLPFRAGHETLWRTDRLYDAIIEIGYNDAPPKRGRGSAIFLHVAAAEYKPTEGCVALAWRDLRALLPRLSIATQVRVHPPRD